MNKEEIKEGNKKDSAMTVDDLLKPRYKVIGDYPAHSFDVGTILHKHHTIEDWVCDPQSESLFYGLKQSCVLRYPHLFKRLEWWEDRKPEDLPEYIKMYMPIPELFRIVKVEEWQFRDSKSTIIKSDGHWRELSIADLPSTKIEYDSYINKKP